MNWQKTGFYLMHGRSVVAGAVLPELLTRLAKFSKKHLWATVSNTVSVRWHTDFKCMSCKGYLGVRYLKMDPNEVSCAKCKEWFSKSNSKNLRTSIKANYFRSGDPEVDWAVRHYLKPSDTFVDIGACIGYVSALALSICGKRGRVFAFEPMPEFHDNLNEIKSLNPIVMFVIEKYAVSNINGKVTICAPRACGANSSNFLLVEDGGQRLNLFGEVEQSSVLAMSLGAYPPVRGKVDFIKIDVEGHEPEVLESIFRLVSQTENRPKIVFEFEKRNFDEGRLRKLVDVVSGFRKLGYSCNIAGTEVDFLTSMDSIAFRVHPILLPP